ncbi:putative zinc metalloproteinase YIL108W [Danaus plexippus plexippus]|uniref:Zinc metalloproteinase YIL108W n=1 Tax=Danaus plexippus plexippus TaxID=278856 RepID=A0A212F9I8_DANPL|nr:putative zinc metalloproteinase YIL108W [Danaus plexippus plexippus]
MVMDNRIDEENKNEQTSAIFITNFQNGETINYSLVLIKGLITVGPCNNNKIRCTVDSNGNKNSSDWDVCNREFKTIVSLKLGENSIEFEYIDQIKVIKLSYEPRRTNLRVCPVYIICQGHDGCFQSPPDVDNSIESACKRIAIGAKIIQSLTAEKLFESGVGRKTFQLEHEVNQKRESCIIFKSNLNVNKARKMRQGELWTHFGRELMLSDLGSNDRKFLGFISCTRFKGTDVDKPMTHEEIVFLTEAYAALGGGGLALFGTACMYTWPSSVEEIIPRFLDPTPVNSKRFMDDSGYRGTLGACFATTLGSVFHELGHTFDLGHTKDGIMGRDRLGKVFAPVKYDMQGNVDKIKNHYEYNEDTCLLELMLDEYSKGKNTAAEGVLWLNRALLFFELLFQEMLVSLQAKDYEVSMKKIFTVAYEGSVKKYHSWITQQLFNFMCKMSPTFIQILKSFEVENDLKGFEMQLANFNATLHGVRSKIDEFFERNPVCDL